MAFPLGCGLALVLGVVNTFVIAQAEANNPLLLALGVLLIVAAIVCNGMAAGRVAKGGEQNTSRKKGVVLAVVAGILMSTFFGFVTTAIATSTFL